MLCGWVAVTEQNRRGGGGEGVGGYLKMLLLQLQLHLRHHSPLITVNVSISHEPSILIG